MENGDPQMMAIRKGGGISATIRAIAVSIVEVR